MNIWIDSAIVYSYELVYSYESEWIAFPSKLCQFFHKHYLGTTVTGRRKKKRKTKTKTATVTFCSVFGCLAFTNLYKNKN